MMDLVPIGAYLLMFGVNSTNELNKPITVSFGIIPSGKNLRGPPFVESLLDAAPVLLTLGDLGNQTPNKLPTKKR